MKGEQRGPRASLGPRAKGSKAYCMLGFRVPTTSVGAKGGGGEARQSILYARF